MKRIIANYRLSTREQMFFTIQRNSPRFTYDQINAVLDGFKEWEDFTFSFYSDGSVSIRDNTTGFEVKLDELPVVAYDFYVQKRIECIGKRMTNNKSLQTA